MEDRKWRLSKWMPDKVIISTLPEAVMVDPEDYNIKISAGISLQLQLIACRNLSRRALQKCCKIDAGK
jgi:hypothetical protein